eukprot:TRINITY_DN96000_c0_g1_i1.p1 TRINITY_DN96000_c0_g1~~TRINITY_DN96000_c0_g1_i1.p1  ORF type:complete len:294 (-),score=59.22 TRINITY_DN96000_c0_g1_i1:17-868(-)
MPLHSVAWILAVAAISLQVGVCKISQDYYRVLGIERDATAAEIRRAYHRGALACHPDKHPGDADAHSKFLELSTAYDVLSDPQKRLEDDASSDSFAHNFLGLDLAAALQVFLSSLQRQGGLLNAEGKPDWAKIAQAVMSAGKDAAAELGRQALDLGKQKAWEAADAAGVGGLVAGAQDVAQGAHEKLSNLTRDVRDQVGEVQRRVGEGVNKVKAQAEEMTHEVKRRVGEGVDKVKALVAFLPVDGPARALKRPCLDTAFIRHHQGLSEDFSKPVHGLVRAGLQ